MNKSWLLDQKYTGGTPKLRPLPKPVQFDTTNDKRIQFTQRSVICGIVELCRLNSIPGPRAKIVFQIVCCGSLSQHSKIRDEF
jgi:hypothetical protein